MHIERVAGYMKEITGQKEEDCEHIADIEFIGGHIPANVIHFCMEPQNAQHAAATQRVYPYNTFLFCHLTLTQNSQKSRNRVSICWRIATHSISMSHAGRQTGASVIRYGVHGKRCANRRDTVS